jgi:hypothetical protein
MFKRSQSTRNYYNRFQLSNKHIPALKRDVNFYRKLSGINFDTLNRDHKSYQKHIQICSAS